MIWERGNLEDNSGFLVGYFLQGFDLGQLENCGNLYIDVGDRDARVF